MDAIRNFTYQWAWDHLKVLPAHSSVCDVGSRNSAFPAFLAWRGFDVTAVDMDKRFTQWQEGIRSSWHTKYNYVISDIRDVKGSNSFDVACALFCLQHAGDHDIEGFTSLCHLLKSGGLLLTVNEFNPEGTKWERGRDDGDLRIYGPTDLKERIELPLTSSGMLIKEKRFAKADFKNGTVSWAGDNGNANICFICAVKNC